MMTIIWFIILAVIAIPLAFIAAHYELTKPRLSDLRPQPPDNRHMKGLLNGETPQDRKSCYDCAHCKAAVTLWCTNKEAIKARGTQIPGVIHCPFWKPNYNFINKRFHP